VRALAVFHLYPPIHNAGAEWMAHTIFRDWIARGDEVIVVFDGAPTYELDGVLVTATTNRSHVEALARVSDVVVTHLDRTAQAIGAAKATGRPVVHLVHNDRQVQFFNVKPGDDVLLVPNSAHLDHGLPRDYRRVVCRPPVTVADYDLAGRDLEHRDAITLVNLTSPKGSGTFFACAQMLPGRRFLGVLGAYGIQDTKKAGRHRNVTLIAQTPTIAADVYAQTRVLLMPSYGETWGRVAIEAACSGIPTIANPTEGLIEALGDAGIFRLRANHRAWVAELQALDDPGYYAERSAMARARALELETVTLSDLDVLHSKTLELIEDRRRANGALYHHDGMAILDSIRAGLRCPVCGAGRCACKPDASAINAGITRGVIVIDRPDRRFHVTPHPVYRTWRGQFRYAPEHAIRYGLIPDPESTALPPPIRLRVSAAPGEHLERAEAAYRRATLDGRGRFLTDLALTPPKAVAGRLSELLGALESTAGTPGPEVAAAAPSAPTARVGDVLEWTGRDAGRIREALDLERAGRNRPTLVAELERRLEED
jgi:glycosyltransferase involved in cell wall biosynthesis